MKTIRNFLNSMRGQLFILLTLGIAISAIISFLLAYQNQREVLLEARANQLASDISGLIETLEATLPSKRDDILSAIHILGVHAQLPSDNKSLPPYPADSSLQQALNERLNDHKIIYTSGVDTIHCPHFNQKQTSQHTGRRVCQLVVLKLSDGSLLQLNVYAPSRLSATPHPGWVAPTLFFLFVIFFAFLASRMATSPLQQLADAADKLEIAKNDTPLNEVGSSEVRAAIHAFNQMRQRIHDDLLERTGMLAAITHDLQTPMTRLRLRLEKVSDDDLRAKLIGDMNAMQQMLQEGLDLARSLDANEKMQAVDLDSLLDSLCSDAVDSGQDVRYLERSPVQVYAHPLALTRAFSNLLDNAVKYGQRAEISLSPTRTGCHVAIRDYGPGMPEEELKKVFAPFYRLEQSRSRETGGTGLGLAIAHNIFRQHNGSISLTNHPAAGLEAHVILPAYPPSND